MKNKFARYFIKTIIGILSIFVLLYIIVFAYVSANKKKIIKQVTEEISRKLNGNVTVGNIELSFFSHFPKVSVAIHQVLITDTLYAIHHHAFFQGDDVYVNVSIINMIQKKSFINGFRIEKGSFYLYTDTSGYTNKYLFNPKRDSTKSATGKGKNELNYIVLNNVNIIDDDQHRNKLFNIQVNNLNLDLLDKDPTTFQFSAQADLLIHSLAFNLKRGSFVKEKTFSGSFAVLYNKKLKQILLDSINVNIEDHPFNISAKFDMEGNNRQFNFRVHAKNIHYDFAKSLLTHKIDSALSIGDVDKPLDVDADLSGPLIGGNPVITVNFSTKEAHLKTPFLDFDNATFTGFFFNEVVPGEPRLDPNSEIVLKNFSASWQDLPVTSERIEVVNLVVPQVNCDLHSHFPLTTLNEIIGSNAIELQSGEGSADIYYKGPITKNNNTNSFINGNVTLTNGNILYTPRNVELKNVDGKIEFKNSDVFVENLQCEVLKNKIVMEGKALNLLTLINAEPNRIKIDWSIFSPALNLDGFTFLLQSRKKVVVKKSKRKLGNLADKIDQVLDQGSINVNLKTPHLIYKKFSAENVLADVVLLQDRYLINNVSMNMADGKMNMNGSLVSINAHTHHAKLNFDLNNVDVSKTFTAFNNFGQDGVTAQSLKGRLTAKIGASLNLNDAGQTEPGSMESIVDFSLKDGELNNYEPIKKLQNFLFKHRDFDNIRFAELKDRFEIKNQEVKINRMEIQSSVMSLFVEGIYSSKGNTDIGIQVPLSNIHHRGADFNPENIGVDKKGGSSIHLRGRPGPDGNIKFKLDLFNKFKKQKDREMSDSTK